jgi:hypothetical protein
MIYSLYYLILEKIYNHDLYSILYMIHEIFNICQLSVNLVRKKTLLVFLVSEVITI